MSAKSKDQLKEKLKYEWKNIFRALVKEDNVTVEVFKKIVHSYNTVISSQVSHVD